MEGRGLEASARHLRQEKGLVNDGLSLLRGFRAVKLIWLFN